MDRIPFLTKKIALEPKSYLNTIYYEYLFFVFKNKLDLCTCFINTLIIEL